MASWLKRAEDLFEVVDRRAKLVVSDLGEEQQQPNTSTSTNTNAATTASSGKGARRSKAKARAKKRAAIDESSGQADSRSEENQTEPSKSDSKHDDKELLIDENTAGTSGRSDVQTSNEAQDNIEDNTGEVASSDNLLKEAKGHEAPQVEAASANQDEAVSLSSNGNPGDENAPSVPNVVPSSASAPEAAELNIDNRQADSDQNIMVKDTEDSVNARKEESLPKTDDAPNAVLTGGNEANIFDSSAGPDSSMLKQENLKTNTSLNKVQDQLDEAQGLLKSTNPTGKSKEARLARVCAGLSSRLQEYKSENAQLEELLQAERELSKSCEDRMKQLQLELSAAKKEVSRAESNMAEALAAKNSEIETLVSSLDSLKKQAALSEGNMASLQANMETLMRNRELSETRMMQALREELALAERRAEEERVAHNATKKAAMEREVEMEHRSMEASSALARIQRMADERATTANELEQKVSLLEVECASLNQELQDMEARLRREQKKSPEDANQLLQIQAWQQEAERARQGQREAESKLSSLEAELQKMRVEMAAMKRDAEHYSRQEHMELEKRYRELTDLLYYKQTQLETMASEKAAAEFQLEKEIKRLQDAQAETERNKISRRASTIWDEEADMKELEPLPLHQRHLAGASFQLRKAAKFLDSGAVSATRILWRHPRARVGLLCYLVFVHLFLMYLLHRLQAKDDALADRELARTMGLSQPNLP